MKYNMLTAYGLSTQTDSCSPNNPIHGHGQGATCAPPSWNFNSDIILKIYPKEAHGCIIKDSTENISQERDANMFVDNQTMQHNDGKYDNVEKTFMQLVHDDINLWDNLLYVISGLLESMKSGYVENNGTPRLKKEAHLEENTVHLQCEGRKLQVQRYAEDKGIQMLGVHKALNLQEIDSLKLICTKTITFAKAIKACPIPSSK
eukprot:4221559-Ditylum_brightwellii.AAC.1